LSKLKNTARPDQIKTNPQTFDRPQFPLAIGLRKKGYSYNHKTTILPQALYLEIKPLKSTLATEGEDPKIAITQKALKFFF
jgi:hypothetical protein